MLRTLHVRDFVIVDQATIDFDSGFTVFSGETGAGKSILIDALSLVLGARGDAKAIREGCTRTEVSAHFDCPPDIQGWLSERDFDVSDELILRRLIDQQGRNRSYINGGAATLTQLRELGELLVDIHGQHAHQSLMNPQSQYDLLDSQGGHLPLARQVAQAWQQLSQARKAVEQASQSAEQGKREQERLEWQINELSSLNLRPGEWDQLQQEHTRLSHAQALIDGSALALNALDGEETSVQQLLGKASHEMSALLRHDPGLQAIVDALESAQIAVTEAASDLNSYLSDMELDPERLAQAEERVSAIFSAARKLKVEPQDLPSLLETWQEQLAQLQQSFDLHALQARARQAEQHYQELGGKLSAARRKTSVQLSKQVSQAMQSMAMQGGRFEVALTACAPQVHGLEQVEFLVAGHEGVTPRPLAKVASGGELARISLALSVIASQAARVPTLIFDEVDTGVGGAVAEVVGRLLQELGARHQVLCVTHLPQVAACGNHHLKVEKTSEQGQTFSSIRPLSEQERVDEIARMLGGLEITQTTREHAREMLARQR
ncbi:DNA repair protein RecN [Alcaligenes ammonioxydans]|jgi:DNA repair protein RecN (Recombination protein N)|uniref:DNA repair protein RecN n=1 Tax=Alcaligenes TaxID=507 RepID=UPI000269E09B|nr:DNA repair protein RecN [Alcaligenes ammonioxydans]EJC62302.1 DNA repair protein [Alcaligenes faecalis subsp. faecalis NCIB 8687]MCH1880677.1 DNA repair protein RecN [Alcaligenes ammonioxydans]HRK86609.1 DNA repair protein RecN [Alcaligenes faecalis]